MGVVGRMVWPGDHQEQGSKPEMVRWFPGDRKDRNSFECWVSGCPIKGNQGVKRTWPRKFIFFIEPCYHWGASQVVLVVKNPRAKAGDIRDVDLIPRLGRSPGGGCGNPLQYSCLENLMDRGAWRATVRGITKSWTQLKQSVLGVHWKDWCWSWNSNTLATWCKELTHWKSPWLWERLRAEGEGDDRGWDGWMALPTQWTWVWVDSGSRWWTGRAGVLWFGESQRFGHDWATELNWGDVSMLAHCPQDPGEMLSVRLQIQRWGTQRGLCG